jgi:hypothetical protein
MRIVAALHSDESIRKFLACLGIPARSPPLLLARAKWHPWHPDSI